eukprot:gnl/MRDRNA2_/MRDRNA2_90262_c0_seq1.p1 gnl/MRDRNA2_/MRDRNA2_90262_c0~~gnl/MRDRNA2_/MRDRNA2_90262_c0_seq1.p1  ORF type:complete len:307 (-),score=55.36 gnl/MRDRNA2_/MRDRNA2_90262_c0_seq1:61-981(-)
MIKTSEFMSMLALAIATQNRVTPIVGLITDLSGTRVANGYTNDASDDPHQRCDAQAQSNDKILSPSINLNPVEMSHESRTRNILNEVFKKQKNCNGELLTVHRSLDTKNGTVLSFGANEGTELLELMRRFPNSQAWGYEIDKKLVKENQQRLKLKGVHEFTSNFDDLPEHGFDFIACNFVMLCKMSPSQFEGFMHTFGKLLKKDGMLELVVYDEGVHPKSGFDPRVIKKYTDKYPMQPTVYRSIPHPDRDTLPPAADSQQQAIQDKMKRAHMELFMLWPNRGAEEVTERRLRGASLIDTAPSATRK